MGTRWKVAKRKIQEGVSRKALGRQEEHREGDRKQGIRRPRRIKEDGPDDILLISIMSICRWIRKSYAGTVHDTR